LVGWLVGWLFSWLISQSASQPASQSVSFGFTTDPRGSSHSDSVLSVTHNREAV
jgi:hypothetical protein